MEQTEPTHKPRRRFDPIGLITYIVGLSFVIMLISGMVLFLAPSGEIQRRVGWTLLGLGRDGWQTLHLSFAVAFIFAGVAHITCNWSGLLHHLRDRKTRHLTLKWEVVIALVFTLLLLVSAIAPFPPASTLHDLNRYFRKDFWVDAAVTNGKVAAPTSAKAPIIEKIQQGTALPTGHPVVSPGQACSACHRK